MKRNRLLLLLFALIFLATSFIGVTYSAWIMTSSKNTEQNISPVVPTWNFVPDSALLDHISGLTNLSKARETDILSPNSDDGEAVRFTNTNGTSGGDHSFYVSFDRDYTVGEVKNYKIEFDYYHSKKNKNGNTYPKAQLYYNSTKIGNERGGGTSTNDKTPFIVSDIDENWWHIEFFISSLAPTMVDHGDKLSYTESQVINKVKISDGSVKDFNSTTAYFILDNLRFNSSTASRLGIFNNGTSFAHGKYYWVKVCWAGEIKSVNITFSDDTIAKYDYDPERDKSPFYIYGLQAGSVTITVTMVLGDNNQVLTISNDLTVT